MDRVTDNRCQSIFYLESLAEKLEDKTRHIADRFDNISVLCLNDLVELRTDKLKHDIDDNIINEN